MKPETFVSADGRETVLIHYIVDGKIVCMPGLTLKDMGANKERQAPHMRSDVLTAVTCPLCKKVTK